MFSITVMEGRLVADPELKKLPSGLSLANLTIACEDDIKRDGKKTTTFLPCTFFGATAENVSKFFKKGRAIIVTGRLKQEEYGEPDAEGHKKIGYRLNNCTFSFPLAESKKEEGAPEKQAPTGLEAGTKEAEVAKDSVDVVDDDLPF
jgi:single-strand DNA-binding protein